jgi:hypothetical protein
MMSVCMYQCGCCDVVMCVCVAATEASVCVAVV